MEPLRSIKYEKTYSVEILIDTNSQITDVTAEWISNFKI